MSSVKLVIFIPSIEGGGVEKNLYIIANYLSIKLKNEVYVITADKKNTDFFSKSVKIVTSKFLIPETNSRLIKYFISLILLLFFFLKNKEIAVLSFQANIYAIILCKIIGVKIIVRSNSSTKGWSNNIFKDFIFKFFLGKSEKVIVNSYALKNEFIKKFNLKSICIYNPFNKDEVSRLARVKFSLNFYNTRIKILRIINVARLTDQKDQLTLFRALNSIKEELDFRLLILGSGVNKNKLDDYIKENSLEKRIKLINYNRNPFKFIKKSEIFILTSLYEGLPNVLLEAISLKKFIISSDCPTGPREILLNGKGGFLFKVGDYKDLAQKIINYTLNKKKLNKKTIFAYKNLKRFDYNNSLKKYLFLINKYLLK
jgi:glycosyltransferase involved in cell wall biosynthesis